MASGTVTTNGQTAPRGAGAPNGRGKPNGLGRQGLLVCRKSTDGGMVGVHLKRENHSLSVQRMAFPTRKDHRGQAFLKRCNVVVVLSKTDYLVRVLEVPKASPDELDAMLRLEVDAFLPPDLGEVEVSYRPLPARRDGYQRFEAYIVRRSFVDELGDELQSRGLTADLVLPSAIIWSMVFDRSDGVDLLVAAPTVKEDAAEMELAIREPDTSLSIRSFRESPQGFGQTLLESLRSLLASTVPGGEPVTVGWIGAKLPEQSIGAKVEFRQLADLDGGRLAGAARGASELDFLAVAGIVLCGQPRHEGLDRASLLPRHVVTARLMKRMGMRMAASVGCVVVGLMCLYGAMTMLAWRYGRIDTEIRGLTAAIMQEGKAVEWKLGQLEVVRQARLTNGDFAAVLDGLLDATSQGVTYSQVELSPEHELRLRGQSESLASALLLPEEIEKQPVFDQVLLRDVAQTNRAGGGITEFRIDCRFVRPEVQ